MTPIGPVDLLCRDEQGRSVAVEIKRRGEIDGVEQLTRYLELLNRDSVLAPVAGVFAAQQIKPQARTLAVDRGIRCLILGLRQDAGHGQRRVPAVLMARRRAPRKRAPARAPAAGAAARRNRVPTATTTRCGPWPRPARRKIYRCPGCDHEIRPATAHVVVWPTDSPGRRRGPAALAHVMLDEPRDAWSDPQMVVKCSQCAGQCEPEAGSTSSISTPPPSLGWMKLIREFAVPRRGAS